MDEKVAIWGQVEKIIFNPSQEQWLPQSHSDHLVEKIHSFNPNILKVIITISHWMLY